MSNPLLAKLVEKIEDEAIELIPIAVKSLQALLDGKAPEKVLDQAERAIIAQRSQKAFDDALAGAHGKPNTGG